MRLVSEGIKDIIREDVNLHPKEPHLWRRETREVAFGGEGAMERLMPIDVDSIRKSFEKVEKAEKEAIQNYNQTKKRVKTVVVKASREYLEGLTLNVAQVDDEGDEGDEDEEENDYEGFDGKDVLSNDKFKVFTEDAEGEDVQKERDKRRRQKGQRDRVGKLFPVEGDVVDAEKGTVDEVNYSSWIHWKEAPDEFKTVKALSALGKFKGKLKKHRESKNAGGGGGGFGGLLEGIKKSSKQQPQSNPNPFMSVNVASVETEVQEMSEKAKAPETAPLTPPPMKEEEIDWEAKAQEFLAEAQAEDSKIHEREVLVSKILKKAPPNSKVIMAVKYKPEVASETSSIISSEAKNCILRSRAAKRTPSAPSIFKHLKQSSNVEGQDSLLSEFDYYNSVSTPIIDIGAASSVQDLVGWGDNDIKIKVAEISMLKARKHEELRRLIEKEEDEDERRREEERRTKHPSRRRRVKIRNEKERKERREVIVRIRQENELIVANKMAEFGLIR
ncbi:hypothetical protein TrVE_jg5694 [Triparma verrucosa]|uniref:Uncharacterized protein n=1 Tax=Triparma verrucosa TaxID=1606542 RepID=A0A9W7CA02_9STRA|nr:hypothetical protein TrVE_jg5694 [Triparma verrucosa]